MNRWHFCQKNERLQIHAVSVYFCYQGIPEDCGDIFIDISTYVRKINGPVGLQMYEAGLFKNIYLEQ